MNNRLIEKYQSEIRGTQYLTEVQVPKQLTFANVVARSSISDNDPSPEPWQRNKVFNLRSEQMYKRISANYLYSQLLIQEDVQIKSSIVHLVEQSTKVTTYYVLN